MNKQMEEGVHTDLEGEGGAVGVSLVSEKGV